MLVRCYAIVMRWQRSPQIKQHKRQQLSILLSVTKTSLPDSGTSRRSPSPFDMLSDGNAVPMAAVAPEPGALELQTLAEATPRDPYL